MSPPNDARRVARQVEVAAARARRIGLALNAVVAVAVVALLVVGAWSANQTRDTAQRLEDCTIPTGACYKQLTKGGQGGLVRLIDYFSCALLILPAERTQVKLDACKARALTIPGGPK